MPNNDAYLEKPRTFMITKSHKNDYLHALMKEKANVPSPDKYTHPPTLLFKKNISIYKKDR